MKYYLAGDIGGTNARLAIFDSKLKIVLRKDFSSKAYKNLSEVVKEFLKNIKHKVSSACFGVPGAVIGGICKTTNLPWTIDCKKMKKEFKFPVFLINDFEALCRGINSLKQKDFIVLRKGSLKGPFAVIGAGTGLGEGFVIDGKEIASEGGHEDFAPRNKKEIRIFEHLKKKYGHVSYERVLSGSGIKNIQLALNCSKNNALKTFSEIYGAEAGNLALKIKSGTVFLAGGIAPHIIPRFKKEFLKAFDNKGRMKELLKRVTIKIIKNPDVGLIGAANYILK